MEELLIKKLESKYIFQIILDYIKDKNILLKLFSHSKLFQNKLGVSLIDYQKIFLKKFFFENYLCFNTLVDNHINFDKDKLKNYLKNDLLQYKLDYNKIINNQQYLIYYFKKYYEKIKEEGELYSCKNPEIIIDIYSPFFETLSKTEFFSDIFSIKILSAYLIKKYSLTKDYKNAFNKINKLNSKYSSILLYYEDKEDINLFNELEINFDDVKKLLIFIIDFNENINKSILFSFNDKDINLKNLIKLRIDSKTNKSIEIESDTLENINNLNLLEELQLNNLIFNNNFTVKLYNLKKLYISYCKNIAFGEDKPYNIEILELNYCDIIKPKEKLKFPKLKKYYVSYIINSYYRISFFDIITSPKLLDISIDKFNDYNNEISSIEYLNVGSASYNRKIHQKMIEKIISMKNLKYIAIPLYNIDNDDILKIQGENISIKEANIFWLYEQDCILYNLQNKFPNLSNLNIIISDMGQGFNQNSESSIEILENPKYKINQFSINSFLGMNIKFYIQSYENLVSVNFDIDMRFDLSKNNFPIFSDKCKIIFKSLKSFKLVTNRCYRTYFDIINNIYNNLDNMPNLKNFVLKCNNKDITNEFSVKFIMKILSMKLYNIELCLTNQKFFDEKYHEEYSLNELKEICPNININSINHICIKKFNEKDDDY